MRGQIQVLLLVVAGIVIGALSCLLPLGLFAALIAGIIYAGVCAFNLRIGLLITMLARSSLDYFNTYSFEMPGMGGVNIAAVLGVLMLLLAACAVLTGTISFETPLSAVWILFLGTSVFCVAVSREPAAGIQTWLKFASLASFYIMVHHYTLADNSNISKFLRATVYSSLVPLLMGIYQLITGTGNLYTPGLNRLNGTFVHPNPFAYYLLIVIAACFVVLYQGMTKGAEAAAIWSILLLVIAELFFTYTRGAWLGLLALSALIFLKIRSGRKVLWALAFALCLIPAVPVIASRFSGLLSGNMEESSLATRFYIWKHMFLLSMESPYIGHGLGTFESYAQQTIGWYIEAHNEYLRMFFETGCTGLASYLLLMLCALNRMESGSHMKKSAILIAAPSLLLTFLMMSASDNIIDNLVSQWYLWAFIAMAHVERRVGLENTGRQQVLLP